MKKQQKARHGFGDGAGLQYSSYGWSDWAPLGSNSRPTELQTSLGLPNMSRFLDSLALAEVSVKVSRFHLMAHQNAFELIPICPCYNQHTLFHVDVGHQPANSSEGILYGMLFLQRYLEIMEPLEFAVERSL
jgi:hypothetical protein